MGVDWIPCKVEPGYSREDMEDAVRREARCFRMGGPSIASSLLPLPSEAERAQIDADYLESGRLADRLLFKRTSHRIYVVTYEPLFPIEWRLDAERTILPWELESQLQRWQEYREEVARGLHESYLRQLYVFEHLKEFARYDLGNLIAAVESTIGATAAWAQRPEVAACRDEILSANLLEIPPWPRWPDGGSESDVLVVQRAFERVDTLIRRWNEAVQRGNKRSQLPKLPPEYEEWVAMRLNDPWLLAFLEWVEPWRRGGYGLYRDCE